MKITAETPEHYIEQLPEDRQQVIRQLRQAVKSNLPIGFEEIIIYDMIGYVVPKSLYPAGYRCDTRLPLPFINIASQKNFVAFYHMGIYANPDLLSWFTAEYPKHCRSRLDMGKSCVRFNKLNDIPYALLGELVAKVSVDDWIKLYESSMR